MAIRLRPDGRRLRTAVRKLAKAGVSGWWLLLQAEASILTAASLVRNRPRGELIRALAKDHSEPLPGASDVAAAEEVALAIDRAARFGFGRPLCLVRSIALHRLLERRGIAGSRINVGVRMNGRAFEAHAWVELEGRVLGDDPSYVRHFNRLSDSAEGLAALAQPAGAEP